MKQRPITMTAISILCSAFLLVAPLAAYAEGGNASSNVLDDSAVTAPVIITEVQTGGLHGAGEEFVELYNISDVPVDITGWQVRYLNASVAADAIPTLLVEVKSPDGDPIMLAAHGYFVLRTASVTIPADLTAPPLDQLYTASSPTALTKTDKTVALFKKDASTCQWVVQDAVTWKSSDQETTSGEGDALNVTPLTLNKDKLLERQRDQLGAYVDSNNNAEDFLLLTDYTFASPGEDNSQDPAYVSSGQTRTPSPLQPIKISGCLLSGGGNDPGDTPDDPGDSPPSTPLPPDDPPGGDGPSTPSIPESNIGLRSPQISELLPNPATPLSDSSDEFIELYNPNDAAFDLSGYELEAGLATKHRYTIPDGTMISPKTFLAFFSADTKLSLSNSGSQVGLLDPLGTTLAQSEPYGTAKEGQAWLLANGKWQWTTRPTPNALNIVSVPAVKSASTTKPAKKPTKKTTSATKRPSTSKTKSVSTKQDISEPSGAAVAAAVRTPVHPGVLALIAISAVLYGAYEYRHDVANKLYQFRNNRAARRALRQGAKGR